MANDRVFEQLQQEWEQLLLQTEVPEASTISQHPPGPYSLFAMLEEPLEILLQMRDSGLLTKFGERYINSSWSVRDLLIHLASWAQELRRQVETLAAGHGFDYAIPFGLSVMGPTEWNRKEIEKRSESGIEDAIHEYERETKLVQDIVLNLPFGVLYASGETPFAPSGNPAERSQGSIAIMVFAQSRHFAYHFHQIHSRLRGF